MEADDLLACNRFGKFFTQTFDVPLLHHEYEIGPTDVAFGDTNAGIGFSSCRTNGMAGKAFVNFLSSKTAPTISAADEENFKCFVQKGNCLRGWGPCQ